MSKKPVVLMVLDGYGLSDKTEGNAVALAKTPVMDKLMATAPFVQGAASGLPVGLPDGQMGNSEVGHLNMGAGRVVYQELTRISKAIREGDFFTNPVLIELMTELKESGKPLHLMGLLSDGGVHSHTTHLYALLKMAKDQGLKEVWIHAFLDGRDVPPNSGLGFVKELEGKIAEIGIGKIATVSGRYYGMDRDQRWEREQLAYDGIALAEGAHAKSAVEAVEQSYQKEEMDEFVKPTVIGDYEGLVPDSGVIFFNFRPDRARQLTTILSDCDLDAVYCRIGHIPLRMVTFTQYEEGLKVKVAFPPQTITHTLGEVLSENGIHQLRIAETEKYAHVTFFFNGGEEKPTPGEERILIPSPKVATYDLQPEMSALEVKAKLLEELKGEKYQVFILNFANCDMVGHTGDYSAAVKAVETVDRCLGEVIEQILAMDGSVLITADHGNAEKMTDENGNPWTAHTTNPVPLILVSKKYEKVTLAEGSLADVAPTLLEMAGLAVPKEMTGKSLIRK